jgi:hypothetical protein
MREHPKISMVGTMIGNPQHLRDTGDTGTGEDQGIRQVPARKPSFFFQCCQIAMDKIGI